MKNANKVQNVLEQSYVIDIRQDPKYTSANQNFNSNSPHQNLVFKKYLFNLSFWQQAEG